MISEVIRVYTKLTIRVVPSCFLLHVVSEHDPFLIPIACWINQAKMPVVNCPEAGCEYATANVGDAVGAVLLTHHLNMAHGGNVAGGAAAWGGNVKKPDRTAMKEDSSDQE